jgi:hypothetical protein
LLALCRPPLYVGKIGAVADVGLPSNFMWAMCSRSSACRKNVSYADGRARSTLDDVVQTSVLTGLPTNMLRPSLEAASIDLAAQRSGSDSLAAAIARDGNFNTSRDLYSAGTLSAA